MRSDDFEAGVFGLELFPHGKGDYRCEISGEEVFLARLQFPVIDLSELGEAVLGEVLGEPLDRVVGRDGVVDEGDEGVR
jgi:hypothetical protein